MTATSSLHSNALNFMSSVQGGVDPRTGLYTASITFGEPQANDLRGPGFTPKISFSPLNRRDTGYGIGWTLQLTRFTLSDSILSLSTGETFKVTSAAKVGQLFMHEKKLDSFHFYKDTETSYRVVHKSGQVEVLKVYGISPYQVALPVEIHAPTGHKITLEHARFSNTDYRLDWIKDGAGQTLLTVSRDSSFINVKLMPDDDGTATAQYIMRLTNTDDRIAEVILPTEEKASWRFDYDVLNDYVCIISMDTPAGGREEMLYRDLGHQFPSASGRRNLPRVTDHRTHPGSKQPMVDVRFEYPDVSNFVGGGLSIEWADDGQDNLYKYAGDYGYVTNECLYVGDDVQPTRTIERKFNKFHLLTEETTSQNAHVHSVTTAYHLTPGAHFDAQPNYFQLPKTVTTAWVQGSRRRSETVSTTFDSQGNLLSTVRPNGVVETTTWFPAAGGDGCPADPEDFVRYKKDHTVTPAASARGNAPTLCSRYRYKSLPAIAGSPLKEWIAIESETLVQLLANGESELQRVDFKHFDLPENDFLHARIDCHTMTLAGNSTVTTFEYEKLLSPELNIEVLQTRQTLTTEFDGVSRTTMDQRSLKTAQALLTLVDDVETRYVYDAMNRVTEEIAAPGTEFEARRGYEYVLCTERGQHAEQISTNARKLKTRTVLDGVARVVYVEQDHVDNDDVTRTRELYAATYNALGQIAEDTLYDAWGDKEWAVTTRYAYDHWAQECRVTGPDGVQSHEEFDPIGTEDSKGPILTQWRQDSSETPVRSSYSKTWINPFQKPTAVKTLDAAGNVIAERTYAYDGLGRSIEQTDELKQSTVLEYDPWSRVVSNTFPDGSIVKRSYASHSASELPVAINASKGEVSTAVGEQTFDGLERLTSAKVGQRTVSFVYEGGKMQASSKTTAAGESIDYEYNLVLTEHPVSSSTKDENAKFDFDYTSARMTRTQNTQGHREYDYDAHNQLRAERWIGNQKQFLESRFSNSMRGVLHKRTDVSVAEGDGLDTLYHYDDFGRLSSIDQGQLSALFEYDTLGRLSRTTTSDLAGGELVTTLEYDDQEREILRTLQLEGKPARTLRQTWYLDGQLESRQLMEGSISQLKEVFTYDSRGRLIKHECSEYPQGGATLPRDSEGRTFTRQTFTFDHLDNIIFVITALYGAASERARYIYSSDDACQLQRIEYEPARTTPNPTFSYDANGNQREDERGNQLIYDSQSRLLEVKSEIGADSQYRYDSHNHLVASQREAQPENLRFYQGNQLSGVVRDAIMTRFLYADDQPLGQQEDADTSKTLLLLTDANNNVIGESQQDDLRTAVYDSYGERYGEKSLQSLLAFNGELLDETGWYLLGRGYRAYNPALKRFHSPDSLSPFGSGGLNPYTYCLGNPIALRDPTGHEAIGWSGRLRRPDEGIPTPNSSGGGWEAWFGVGVGALFVVLGAIATAYTAGAAAPLLVGAIKGTVALTAAAVTKVVLAASLAASTGLSYYSTVAMGVGVGRNDEKAMQWGSYLGYAALAASLPLVVGGFYQGGSWLKTAVLRGLGKVTPAPGAGPGAGSGLGFGAGTEAGAGAGAGGSARSSVSAAESVVQAARPKLFNILPNTFVQGKSMDAARIRGVITAAVESPPGKLIADMGGGTRFTNIEGYANATEFGASILEPAVSAAIPSTSRRPPGAAVRR